MIKKDDSYHKQASEEIVKIFKQVRRSLKVNKDQSKQAQLFDYLAAIDNASSLLNKAWKISSIYKINNNAMREDFINMFKNFTRMKASLEEELKMKH